MSEGTSPVVTTTAAPDAAGFVGTAARRQWRTVAARFVRHRAALVGLVLRQELDCHFVQREVNGLCFVNA